MCKGTENIRKTVFTVPVFSTFSFILCFFLSLMSCVFHPNENGICKVLLFNGLTMVSQSQCNRLAIAMRSFHNRSAITRSKQCDCKTYENQCISRMMWRMAAMGW